jgi:hypothetical protein
MVSGRAVRGERSWIVTPHCLRPLHTHARSPVIVDRARCSSTTPMAGFGVKLSSTDRCYRSSWPSRLQGAGLRFHGGAQRAPSRWRTRS